MADLDRSDLANFASALQHENAQKSAEVIKDRQNQAEAVAQDMLQQANLGGALAQERGMADTVVFCVIQLITGDYAIEETRVDRANFGDMARILHDEFPFNRYVRSSIIKMVAITKTQQEAVEFVINLKVQQKKFEKIINDRVEAETSEEGKKGK